MITLALAIPAEPTRFLILSETTLVEWSRANWVELGTGDDRGNNKKRYLNY